MRGLRFRVQYLRYTKYLQTLSIMALTAAAAQVLGAKRKTLSGF